MCPVNGTTLVHEDIQPLWDELTRRRNVVASLSFAPCEFLDGPDAPLWDEAGCHDVILPPLPPGGLHFVEANKFLGARPGFFYGNGEKGVGYYPLTPPRVTPEGSMNPTTDLGKIQLSL